MAVRDDVKEIAGLLGHQEIGDDVAGAVTTALTNDYFDGLCDNQAQSEVKHDSGK